MKRRWIAVLISLVMFPGALPADAGEAVGHLFLGLALYDYQCRKEQGIWRYDDFYNYGCRKLNDRSQLELYRSAGLDQAVQWHTEGTAMVQRGSDRGLLWGALGAAAGIGAAFLAFKNETDRGYALVAFPLGLGWLGFKLGRETGGYDDGKQLIQKGVDLYNHEAVKRP